MKILCVSDQIDPLIYSTNAKKRFADIDAVLCAGDLPMDYIDFIVSTLNKPTYFVFGNHNLTEYKYYQRSKNSIQLQSYFYSPRTECMNHQHGAINLGFHIIKDTTLSFADPVTHKRTPLLIAGIPGSLRYNRGENQYTDSEMKFHLNRMGLKLKMNKFLYGRYLDILLTHAPPRHIHDLEDPCHKGFESLNWFISKYHPAYLVHGHVHIYDLRTPRITEYGGTTVVNAYSYHIIEFPKQPGNHPKEVRDGSLDLRDTNRN